jgi:hypothetical protein
VDTVIEFTTGAAGAGVNWESDGSLLEVCASKDVFGSNVEGAGWSDAYNASEACVDL